MAWETERIRDGDLTEIFSWDVENQESTHQMVFRIYSSDRTVEWFCRDQDFPVRPVMFEGFTTVPAELAEAGYIKGPLQYHLARKINERGIERLTISRISAASIRKIRNAGYQVVLPYTGFQDIASRYRAITTASQHERKVVADATFHNLFPNKFSVPTTSIRRRLTQLMSGLDPAVIEEMSAAEIDRVLDFTQAILEERYTSTSRRAELFGAAKLKVDSVALSEVIDTFEDLLTSDCNEAKWGKFLRQNLFLVESRYVHIIGQLNVVLGGTRLVDFGLADTQGFLDLFEIKLPKTKLLAANTDRGNHYWHQEAVKAIVQAEKYLHNAERQADALAASIRRERNIEVKVVRPRAVVVMGSTDQLDTQQKEEDFRVLCASLKNVEVLMYDELLQRLKNQQNKLYT